MKVFNKIDWTNLNQYDMIILSDLGSMSIVKGRATYGVSKDAIRVTYGEK